MTALASHPPAAGVVHIWRAEILATGSSADRFAGILAADERSRAAGCINESESNRFIASRGVLRMILAGYLNRDPQNLRFGYGTYGKPFLDEGVDLQFNLSHSGNWAVCAITRGVRVGIDLENAGTNWSIEHLAGRVLTTGEKSIYEQLAGAEKRMAFFRCWTRKEAFLKASGEGIAKPLDQMEVTMGPNDPPRLLHVWGSRQEASRWSLLNFHAAPGFAGAVAVEGHGWRPEYRDFTMN